MASMLLLDDDLCSAVKSSAAAQLHDASDSQEDPLNVSLLRISPVWSGTEREGEREGERVRGRERKRERERGRERAREREIEKERER